MVLQRRLIGGFRQLRPPLGRFLRFVPGFLGVQDSLNGLLRTKRGAFGPSFICLWPSGTRGQAGSSLPCRVRSSRRKSVLPETAWVLLPCERPRRILHVMGTLDYEYERRMGEWVTARCRKRAEEHEKPMPQQVRDWLDDGGNSPANKNTAPTVVVLGWLAATIIDPDWPDLFTK